MKALEYLLSRPLLISPEMLETAIAIVERRGNPEAVESRKGVVFDNAEGGMMRRGPVAVIPVVGPIYRYADFFTEMCGGVTVESLARDLRLALDDRSVQSILFVFDSPGGEVAGTSELAGMIAASTKPTVAYVDHDACSAAYWLATACDEIVCSDTATVGSIGVVTGYVVREPRAGEKRYQFVSSQSPNKRPDMETEAGKAEVQRRVDDLADVFIRAVAANRGVTPETVVSDFGAGGLLVGQKAVDAGMADRIGTFEGTLDEMARGAFPRREGSAAAAAEASEGQQPMFSFLFKPKADGSFSVEPQPATTTPDGAVKTGATIEAPAVEAKAPERLADVAPAVLSFADSPEAKAMRDEIEKLKADAVLNRIKADAAAFADGEIQANRALPKERSTLIADFIQASLDDQASASTFMKREGETATTRVARLQATHAARPRHNLTREQLGREDLPEGATVLRADHNDKPGEAEAVKAEVESLLKMTDTGRQALAARK